METLWPDTFVEESSLTQNISLLRRALGESASEQFIETIPKRGYRFVADVRAVRDSSIETIIHETSSTQLVIEEQLVEDPRELVSKGTQHLPNSNLQRWSKRRLFVGIALTCLLILSTLSIYFASRRRSNPELVPPRSLAILPFTNIGPANQPDVLGLGIANAIILNLSSLKRATVLPTSSVF